MGTWILGVSILINTTLLILFCWVFLFLLPSAICNCFSSTDWSLVGIKETQRGRERRSFWLWRWGSLLCVLPFLFPRPAGCSNNCPLTFTPTPSFQSCHHSCQANVFTHIPRPHLFFVCLFFLHSTLLLSWRGCPNRTHCYSVTFLRTCLNSGA